MLIDTHKAIERLIAVGNSKESAEVVVDLINSQEQSLATKADIQLLEAKIEKDINWLKAIGLVLIGLGIKAAFFNS